MKKLFVFSLVMVMVFAVSVVSLAGDPVTATADIYAEVLAVIEVTPDPDYGELDFGTLAPGTSPGTVIVGSGGTISTNNIPYHDGNFQAAQFNVTGPETVSYTLSIPAGNVTITETGGTTTMTVNNFTTDFVNGGTIGNFGTFYVGATLNVAANQVAGNYTGTFDVTVNFD